MRDPRFGRAYDRADRRKPLDGDIARARVLGEQIALLSPDRESLRRAHEELARQPIAIWEAFDEGYIKGVHADDARRRAWVDFLNKEIRDSAVDPGLLLLSPKLDGEQFKAQVAAWREEQDPLAVLDFRQRDPISYRGDHPFDYLHLLLLVDRAAWCSAMDALPTPGVMEMALFNYTHLDQDRELIETLIEIAPPVFDEEGRWRDSRSVLALLVIDRVIVHARSLREAVLSRRHVRGSEQKPSQDEMDALENHEIVPWMRKVFRLLLARSDGKHMGTRLRGYLARTELLGWHRPPGETWLAEEQALHRLAEVMASAGLGVCDVRAAWQSVLAIEDAKQAKEKSRRVIGRRAGAPKVERDHGEGAVSLQGEGLPLLLGAAIMLGNEPQDQSELEAFWSWFVELLEGRDPGLSLVTHGSSIVHMPQRFGFLLSMLPGAGALFRNAYIALEPLRRRAEF